MSVRSGEDPGVANKVNAACLGRSTNDILNDRIYPYLSQTVIY